MAGSSALRARVKPLVYSGLRRMVVNRASRKILNVIYAALPDNAKVSVYQHFSKIFRSVVLPIDEGSWRLTVAGRPIRMPLRSDRAWLDWDQALSLIGHEHWIKRTYSTFLTGPVRPDLFVDIGANYGTHSLLFLCHGIDVVTFEPNASCHAYFHEACELNNVSPTLHPVALGAERGTAELSYPERETWLGSVASHQVGELRQHTSVVTQSVDVVPLRDYESAFRGRLTLVKIDAEDYELPILLGAGNVIDQHRPVVLFEARKGHDRDPLVHFFRSQRYELAQLPVLPERPIQLLTETEIVQSNQDDFIAIPSEYCPSGTSITGSALFESMRQTRARNQAGEIVTSPGSAAR